MTESTIQLASAFELLGRLWVSEVDLTTLEEMATNPFRDLYQELGGSVPDEIDEQATERLAVEYCSLLIGPKGHISPVESVWASDQLQANTASSMHRFFELLPDYQPRSSFPDHVGVQLDFAGALLRAGQSEEGDAAEVLNHFAKTHFVWTSDFLNKVIDQTDSDFYRGLAVVTKNLIGQMDQSN